MKIVDKSKCQGKETMLASEVAILRQVCHPNIISLISEHETTDQLFLVMELVKVRFYFNYLITLLSSNCSVLLNKAINSLGWRFV